MKTRNRIIIGLVIFLLASVTIGFFFIRGQGTNQKQPVVTPTLRAILPTVDPSVEVNLSSRKDGRAVILAISSLPSDVESIDYELTYITGEGLPRGVLGNIKVKEGEEIKREILLGTCSKNTCSYDEGVNKVSLVLKFNSPSGASQFQKEYLL